MVAERKQKGLRRNGTVGRAPKPVYFPEADGKPMAEGDIQRDEMVRRIQTLQGAFADRADVYVTGNMLLYYEEGNPRASVAPDGFVVFGVPKRRRPIYKLWEEGRPPSLVFEVTSKTTRREDEVKKRLLYARLGVAEYVMYDPTRDYLRPPLQLLRLQGGEYAPVHPGADGSLVSGALGLRLVTEGGLLRLYDGGAGERLLTPEERLAGEIQERRRLDARIAALEEALRERPE